MFNSSSVVFSLSRGAAVVIDNYLVFRSLYLVIYDASGVRLHAGRPTEPLGNLGTLDAQENGEAFFSGVKPMQRVVDLIDWSIVLYETENKSDSNIAAAVIARNILEHKFPTHKNAKHFPNPENFDPSRFEGKGPAPYTFVPFGGGLRMCPGIDYAWLVMLVFIHNLVTKFRREEALPKEKTIFVPLAMPEKGLPIRLQAHSVNLDK
ncbi:hypothetical protein IFM89_002389 [Coptis chinensis]|uniref:Cytochrome P450 n=1 Tax=Coptis chinensis TaxID=261450 RepID=A0A835IK99_9MAGN|nr:hypothetical protein IFM89_002389 [Coptis chinensis]